MTLILILIITEHGCVFVAMGNVVDYVVVCLC